MNTQRLQHVEPNPSQLLHTGLGQRRTGPGPAHPQLGAIGTSLGQSIDLQHVRLLDTRPASTEQSILRRHSPITTTIAVFTTTIAVFTTATAMFTTATATAGVVVSVVVVVVVVVSVVVEGCGVETS
jgi:hypothetical protein